MSSLITQASLFDAPVASTLTPLQKARQQGMGVHSPYAVVSRDMQSYRITNLYTGRMEYNKWRIGDNAAFAECDRLNRAAGYWTSYLGEPCPNPEQYIIAEY